MKFNHLNKFNGIIISIFIILKIILYSNCFKFTSDPDDLIIKFNVENEKFKNTEYINNVKKKVKTEMKLIKNHQSFMKLPEDLESDYNVNIYEMQTKKDNNTQKDNNFDEDESGINDFEEKDLIRSI
jgi:hypothetical protein